MVGRPEGLTDPEKAAFESPLTEGLPVTTGDGGAMIDATSVAVPVFWVFDVRVILTVIGKEPELA